MGTIEGTAKRALLSPDAFKLVHQARLMQINGISREIAAIE
ncbi:MULTISPECIES: hypothetical protein [unclassified Sphingomonas]|nr:MULTISPECIES: hypothetical protein [unclassified Sphingomonas]